MRHTESLIELLRGQIGAPQCGAEIGVWRGDNALGLMHAFPDLRLCLVDAYRAIHQTAQHYQVTQAECDRAQASMYKRLAGKPYVLLETTSLEAAQFVPAASLDFVFIDAAHDYPSVRSDLDAWLPAVRCGGILCGHDYNGRGDARGIFGVKRAVDEVFGDAVRTAPARIWWVKVVTLDRRTIATC